MRKWLNVMAGGLLVRLGVLTLEARQAADITILAGMGVISAVRDLAPAFERASGHKVIVSFESTQELARKVNAKTKSRSACSRSM